VDDERRVKKGHHCAWQIHYHIVFPVKYRRSLLDEEVVKVIRETAAGIEERYENRDGDDGHGQKSYPPSLRSTSETLPLTHRPDL
jgi:hypothetical protein